MGEIVNLRRARKRQAIAAAEKQAEANRLAHGQSKDERLQMKAERTLAETRLDAHRLEQPSGDGE